MYAREGAHARTHARVRTQGALADAFPLPGRGTRPQVKVGAWVNRPFWRAWRHTTAVAADGGRRAAP